MLVLDFGKNSATMYNSVTDSTTTLTHSEVLQLNKHYKSTRIIVEYAHMGVPRTKKSLAQPYTQTQLDKFYKACEKSDNLLQLFPERLRPIASAYAGNRKSDDDDPVSIYKYMVDFPNTSLALPHKNNRTSKKRVDGWLIKAEINTILNYSRSVGYEGELFDWIVSNIEEIVSKVPKKCKAAFGLDDETIRYKSNRKGKWEKGDINIRKIKSTQLVSILSLICGEVEELGDEEYKIIAKPRLRNGQIPGWRFIKRYVVGMTPFHLRGGIARSNLYYHGMPGYINARFKQDGMKPPTKPQGKDPDELWNRGCYSKEQHDAFIKYRNEYTKAIQQVFFVFKDILERDMVTVKEKELELSLV